MMFSLSNALGFALDTPWQQLPEKVRQAILYGIEPTKDRHDLAAGRKGEAARS